MPPASPKPAAALARVEMVVQGGGMSRPLSLRHAAADAARDALTFWLPQACAGCDALDVALCDECHTHLAPEPHVRALDGGVTVSCALRFDGVPARVLRALKEEGRTSLARALAPALAEILEPLAAGATITTVPSSRAALRRRGYRPVEILVRRAGWHPERLLRVQRAPRDQRGLDRAARRDNVADAFVAVPVRGRRVVIVDDVVTTGATLVEAVRALRAAGAADVVAVAVAHTPRRG